MCSYSASDLRVISPRLTQPAFVATSAGSSSASLIYVPVFICTLLCPARCLQLDFYCGVTVSPASACPLLAHTDSDFVVHTRVVSGTVHPQWDQEFIVEPVVNARAFVVFEVRCTKPAPEPHTFIAKVRNSSACLGTSIGVIWFSNNW
jgi:hypothetical protein